ncbi:MAG: hypothetical protein Gaeavirus1_6 [Gaeavirus sp.]|uniref:Uncharacterized protein n=1 Tax=Gaeavirus sp. TaxID=2487767 RepID=A0A3G5A312_9VIRU|nr:MAG: hypothetical protein Gaeavirus1_6 [Gaeavirus sp.]
MSNYARGQRIATLSNYVRRTKFAGWNIPMHHFLTLRFMGGLNALAASYIGVLAPKKTLPVLGGILILASGYNVYKMIKHWNKSRGCL